MEWKGGCGAILSAQTSVDLDGYKDAGHGWISGLKYHRNMEKQRGIEGDDRVKIIMMTALNEQKKCKKKPLKWAARFIVRSRLIWIN